MNGTLTGAAATLRRSGAQLGSTAGELARTGGEPDAFGPGEPAAFGTGGGPDAFGADGPGRLGELGAELHRRWRDALAARVREARAQADRLIEAGDAVDRAGHGYAEIDRPPRPNGAR